MNMMLIAWTFIQRLLSNKRAWFTIFLLPTLIVTILQISTFINDGNNKITFTIVDDDQSAISQRFVGELQERYETTLSTDYAAIEKQIHDNTLSLAVYIPQGFADALIQGKLPTIQLLRLGYSEQSVLLQLGLEQMAREWLQVAQSVQGTETVSEEQISVQYQHYVDVRPQLTIEDDHLYVAPSFRIAMGLLAMFIMTNAVNTISLMLQDKRNFMMQRLYAAPVRSYEITLGYCIGAFMLGLAQIAIVLIVTRYAFGIELGISFAKQFLMLVLFMAVSIGISSMLAALLKTPIAYTNVAYVIVVPMSMLGGAYWPISLMESYMQSISYFMPQRWLLDAMEQLAAGADMASVGIHIAVLLLFTIIFFSIGSIAFTPAKREVS